MESTLLFTKMHGCGNDFVVFDNRLNQRPLEFWIRLAPKLCDRRFGIGADGLLLLNPAKDTGFTMIYRNADGSDAGMCGNGGRCIAAFASLAGFGKNGVFYVHDRKYQYTVEQKAAGLFFVDLTFPVAVVPERRQAGAESYDFAFTGTEHLVVPSTLNRLNQPEWLKQRGGALRANTSLSKNGANVNFIARDADGLHVQTFERGVEDLTLACGTGALASMIIDHKTAGRKENISREPVHMAGGTLFVSFEVEPVSSTYTGLVLSGPAEIVFEGSIAI